MIDVLLILGIVLLSIVGLIVGSVLVFILIPFRYPKSTESDYTYSNFPFWELYYGHKYIRATIKRAEKGSELESYFNNMAFDFNKSTLKDTKTITIKAVGDLMCRADAVGEGGKHLWDDIGEYLFDADITIGNLEFAVNPDKVIEKPVQFSVPPEQADVFIKGRGYGKFDVFSLANNHLNDSLYEGIKSTCEYLDKNEVKHVGANRNPEEQDNIPIFEFGNIKVAVLSYTFSTNGIPLEQGFEYGVNVVRFNALDEKDYDPSLIHKHIKIAKERGADYIISCHHWCIDLEYYPPKRIVNRSHNLLEAGIDLIIGHHPHVLNPIEHYKTKDNRDGVIFYSLSNLTSHGLWKPIQRMSEIAEIVLEYGIDNNGEIKIRPQRIILTPILHSLNKINGKKVNRLLPIKKYYEKILSEEIPEFLTKKDIKYIRILNKEYEKYFLQKAMHYNQVNYKYEID